MTTDTFQEYFSAFCIARVASRNIEALFSRFAKRYSDSVLPMVSDINADLFREKYILPNAKKFKKFFERKTTIKLYESFASRTGATFTVKIATGEKKKATRSERLNGPIGIMLDYSGDMADFSHVVASVDNETSEFDKTNRDRADFEFVQFVQKKYRGKFHFLHVFVDQGKLRFSSDKDLTANEVTSEEERELKDKFLTSRMYSFLVWRATRLLTFVNNEISAYKKISGAFSDLF